MKMIDTTRNVNGNSTGSSAEVAAETSGGNLKGKLGEAGWKVTTQVIAGVTTGAAMIGVNALVKRNKPATLPLDLHIDETTGNALVNMVTAGTAAKAKHDDKKAKAKKAEA